MVSRKLFPSLYTFGLSLDDLLSYHRKYSTRAAPDCLRRANKNGKARRSRVANIRRRFSHSTGAEDDRALDSSNH